MTTSGAGAAALDAFHRTDTGEARREAFRTLVATVWEEGARNSEAEALAPVLVRALTAEDTAYTDFNGHHAILLGLLLEAERPETAPDDDDPVAEAALAGLDGYLARLAAADGDEPLTYALVYLLAHLGDGRERILAAAAARGLDDDDLSRLARCLAPCDPDDEIGVLRLGRCFPSPAAWTVSDDELREIGGWMQWANLAPESLPPLWQGETNTLLGYSGAKALWAVEHGAIGETPEHVVAHDVVDAPPVTDSDGGIGTLDRYLPILRCTACRGALAGGSDALGCTRCGAAYSVKDGFVDIIGGEDDLEDPLMARFHEKWLRPAFMRLIGGNWAGEVTFADENRWVTEFMRPADGPIVDLGPGAGITTKTLAEKYGAERLIAVDMSASMLARLARRVPGAASVRASAVDMPFPDGVVGAINCWNMLHYFEDKQPVLREIGRVLQPGGSFTLMDLIPEPDHIARYFQGRMGETVVRKLFGPTEIGEWLAKVGMTIQDIYLPGGNFMVLRAVRTEDPLPQADDTVTGGPSAETLFLRGLDVFNGVVRRLSAEDWQRVSPCEGWRALDVLGHLGHCIEFSLQLLKGEKPEWTPAQPPGAIVEGDPVAWWDDIAGRSRSFVEEANLAREVDTTDGKSNIGAGLSFPAIDLYVHGWDIAKSAGFDVEMPAEVIEFCHTVIDPLPYERVRGPRHFGDPRPVPDDATESEKFLAYIGRDSAWQAPE